MNLSKLLEEIKKHVVANMRLSSFESEFVVVTIVTGTESDGEFGVLQFPPEREKRGILPVGTPVLVTSV